MVTSSHAIACIVEKPVGFDIIVEKLRVSLRAVPDYSRLTRVRWFVDFLGC